MNCDKPITRDELLSNLTYNHITGEIKSKRTKRISRAGRERVFKKNTKKGYVRISLDKRFIYAHRAAWIMHYGVYPSFTIDHINGIKDDNRICNLREASFCENNQNKKIISTNTSGVKGVSYDKNQKKWRATIIKNGITCYRKRFDSLEEAEQQIKINRKIIHGDFSRDE